MLYVQALLDDWSFPATDPLVRAGYEQQLADIGVAAMHRLLAEVDPQAAATILDTDGRRIVRALEVVELTGKPFAASAPTIGEPRWGTIILAVDRDTAALDERIARRTGQMFTDGLVAEVEALCEAGLREGVTAPRAIGYAPKCSTISTARSTLTRRANSPSSGPAAACGGNARGSAATIGSPGSTAATRTC